LAPKIFLGRTPNFWTLLGDSSKISIMWQSFAAIGRGTSEMWLPKKTSRVKHKPVRNGGSGRPNKTYVYIEDFVGVRSAGEIWPPAMK